MMICVSASLFADAGDLLILRSGAELQGRFVSLRGSRVRFQPRWSENASVLPIGEIDAVYFGEPGRTEAETPTHRVTFLDGDRLTGRLIDRDEEILTFRVDGDVTLRMFPSSLQSLETLPSGEDLLLDNPMEIDLWQTQAMPGMRMQGGNVQAFRGAQVVRINNLPQQLNAMPHIDPASAHPTKLGGSWFFAPGQGGSLIRELSELPERFRLAYSIRSPGGTFLLNVGTFTRQPFQRGTGGMFFVHQTSHVQGQIFPEKDDPDTGRPPMMNWREQISSPDSQWQHVELFIDRPRNLARMTVNGEQVQEWAMTFDPEEMSGRWLSLQIQHNVAGLQIADIELARWDGSFPGRDMEIFSASGASRVVRSRRSQEAEIRFRSRPDMLTLRIREITEDKVVADGDGFAGPVTLPRTLLAGLRFPWMRTGTGALPDLSIDLDTPILQLQTLPAGGRP